MRNVWTWNCFSPRALTRLAVGCTTPGTLLIVCRQLAARLDIGSIGAAMAVPFTTTRRLLSTCPSCAAPRSRIAPIPWRKLCEITWDLADNALNTHGLENIMSSCTGDIPPRCQTLNLCERKISLNSSSGFGVMWRCLWNGTASIFLVIRCVASRRYFFKVPCW